MKRNTLNYIVDAATALAMLGLVLTGIIIRYALPAGAGRYGAGRARLWGLSRHEWGDVHFCLGVVLVALLLAHLALHWTWICTVSRRLVGAGPLPPAAASNARFVYACVALFVTFAGLTAFWGLSVRQVSPPERARNAVIRSAGGIEDGADKAGGRRRRGRWADANQTAARVRVPAAAPRR